MKAEQIKAGNFKFENITECLGHKAFGEHGFLMIKGVIKKGKEIEYLEQAKLQDKVHVTVTDWEGAEVNLLHGILYDIQFRYENGVPMMSLHIKTGSYLTGLEQHTRSFQTEPDCLAAAKICLRSYPGGNCILGRFTQKKEPGLLMQYRETDWDFLARLASRSHTLILPDEETGDAKLYIGIPRFPEIHVIESDTYSMHKDMEISRRQMEELGLREEDLITFEVEERETFKVGEKVQFSGRSLYISGMDTFLKGSELVHNYSLRTERGIAACRRCNPVLPGNSLTVRVTEVIRDQVTVEIGEDENKTEAGRRLFPFATIYSTPDGTGWYCMPEIGDEARLCFPTTEESDAYIESSVHLAEGNGVRSNPQEKSIMNRQQKEILFTPDSLILRNNKGMSIELLDGEGIKIISDKSVLISAGADIRMNSQAEIGMSAGSALSLQQGAAQLKMADKITMAGGKINMN